MSARTSPWPKGITAQATSPRVKVTMGANTKTTGLALLGTIVSFISSFSPSAMGWNRPKGPTTLGPFRSCMAPITLRSA